MAVRRDLAISLSFHYFPLPPFRNLKKLGEGLELVEVDFGEVGADVLGVTVVDMVPGGFHAVDFSGI